MDKVHKDSCLLSVLLVSAGVAALTVTGCRAPARSARPAEVISDLHEMGRPWPVAVNRFNGVFMPVSHNEQGFVFEIGAKNPIRYRLDYGRRRLLVYPAPPQMTSPGAYLGKAEQSAREKGTLFLRKPDGRQVTISKSLAVPGPDGYAQTDDLSGLAFYESMPGQALQLTYYDQITDARMIWRTIPAYPNKASLIWSPSGRHLLEQVDGQLIVHNRELSLVVATAAGGRPAFAPNDKYLAFLRQDGKPSLLDLRAGFEWPLPPLAGDYRPLPTFVWSQDASRLFMLAEATAAAKKTAPPYLLYLYTLEGGVLRSCPLQAPFNLSRYTVLLQAAQPEVQRLADLIPKLKNGPLVAVGTSGYLVGLGKRVCFLDLTAHLWTLAEFPEPILDLYLSSDGRRLAIVTDTPEKPRLYAWRLPALEFLQGVFPDRRDLTIGKLRLGLPVAKVRSLLGRPTGEENTRDPVTGLEKLETLRYTDVSVTFRRGLLSRIIYSAPGVFTVRGVAVGSTVYDVYERYGRPDYTAAGYRSYHGLVDGKRIKVAFRIGANRKVAAILVSDLIPAGRLKP